MGENITRRSRLIGMGIGLAAALLSGKPAGADPFNTNASSRQATSQQKSLRRQLAEKDALIAALQKQIALLSGEVQKLRSQDPVVVLPSVRPLVLAPGSSLQPLQLPELNQVPSPSPAASK